MRDKPAFKYVAIILSLLALFLVWRNIISPRIKKSSPTTRIAETVRQIARQEILPAIKQEGGIESLINNKALLIPAYKLFPETPPKLEPMPKLKYNPFRTSFLPSKSIENAVKLRLDAIINIKGGKKYAIINGKKYAEGEMIGPVLIKSIEKYRVYLQTPQGEDFLELYSTKREIEINLPSSQGEER